MSLPKWLQVLESVGPVVLAFTPLAPLAPAVIAGIKVAESIPGATGEQKKALVAQIVALGVQGTNAQAGTTVIDPTEAAQATSATIDTIVDTANKVHQLAPAA